MSQKHNTVLEINNLCIQFKLDQGHVDAIKNVSFSIPKEKTVALVGESGSGKTVISQAIMGLLPRSAKFTGGSMMFYDHHNSGNAVNLMRLNPTAKEYCQLRGSKIALIFQEPMTSLSPLHKIGDQIIEAICLHQNTNYKSAYEIAINTMQLCGFPDPHRTINMYSFELSGGLRQRAMIAMALSCQPALLIADEPTTALDVTIQAQILKLIKSLQTQYQMSVLMITHDLGVVANVADEVVVMYHGEIMESGPAKNIFSNPQHPYLQALLEAVPRFNMQKGERLTALREVSIKKYRRTRYEWQRLEACDGKSTIIQANQLSKKYFLNNAFTAAQSSNEEPSQISFTAVNNISFEIKRGECLGLVGESGCGKTTLAKMLMGALSPTSGSVLFSNQDRQFDVHHSKTEELQYYRRHVQFVFQDPFSSLNPRMSVADILIEPLMINQIGDHASHLIKARELMELVGLNPGWLSRYPHSFSGGQRQRISIARALALNPDLILLDEPVSALDVSVQAQILNLLIELKKEMGLSYLFISHNLAVVNYMCDRIAVMCRGRLVEIAPSDKLFAQTAHPYTKALLKAIPEPNLDRLMDFDAILDSQSSDPNNWPEQFRGDKNMPLQLMPISDDHLVYMRPNHH